MEQSHPGNKAPSTIITTLPSGSRRQSVTSNVDTPLSLRSTNSLPTPTPNTVTIIEDVDGDDLAHEEAGNKVGNYVDLRNSGVGAGTTVDWDGNGSNGTEELMPRQGHRASSGQNGRRPSLKERILSASGGEGKGGMMTAHLEEDAVV